MYRKSNLPLSAIRKLYDSDFNFKSSSLLLDEEIINNIYFSSPNLYKMLLNGLNKEEIGEKVKTSLFKYLVRMGSRTSTFQGMGSITDDGINKNFLSINISIKWLVKVLKKITLAQNITSKMQLTINKNIVEYNNYFVLNRYSVRNKQEIIIQKDSIVGQIAKNISGGNITYSSLYEMILYYVKKDEDLAKNLINSLIENEYIYSSIEVVGAEPKLIEKLKEISNYASVSLKKQLVEIIDRIGKVELVDSLSNEYFQKVVKLREDMRKIVSEIEPLVIDRYSRYMKSEEEKVKDIEVDLSILRDFNILSNDYQFINMFENIFLNTYGLYNEIPILQVLNSSLFSERKINKMISSDKEYQKIKENYELNIARIIQTASIEKIDIELEKVVNSLKHIQEKKYYKIDVDIKVRNIGNKLYIAPESIVFPAGSYKAKYKYLKNTEVLRPPFYELDYTLNYIPDIGVNYTKNRKKLNVNDKHIVVGADETGIYIKNLRTNEKILPVFQSLAKLDFLTESYYARFMKKYTDYKIKPPIHYLTEKYNSFPHIPRVVYKNIVLFKESWNLFINAYNDKEILMYIDNFILTYKLPEFVAIYINGNEFPISLKSSRGRDFLKQELKKNKFVTVVEYPEIESSEYLVEKIYSINSGTEKYNVESLSLYNKAYISNNKYLMYIVLLETRNLEKEILRELNLFIKENKYSFFYVRYIENGEPSLRIRIRKNTNLDEYKVYIFLKKLLTKKMIKNYYLSEYIPEYNRYGYEELGIAEKIFELDSIYSIENNNKGINKEEEAIYIILSTLLSKLGSLEQCKIFLDRNYPEASGTKNIRKKYSKNRDYYNKIYDKLNRIIPLDKKYETLLKIYMDKISEKYTENHVDYMIQSMLHMRINRNIGIVSNEVDYYHLVKYVVNRSVSKSRN